LLYSHCHFHLLLLSVCPAAFNFLVPLCSSAQTVLSQSATVCRSTRTLQYKHTHRPCVRFKAPCHYTPYLNLLLSVFGLTPSLWLRSVTLAPTCFIILMGALFFCFYLRSVFQEHK
jgi:hypothetical protein